MKKALSILLAMSMMVSMALGMSLSAAAEDDTKSVGFVTFGLGGDFFQQLADKYVEVMTDAGWDATYEDGQFDPNVQMEKCENYIAMGVDVLVLWSVAPEAMDSVVQQAMDAGIKVIAFVAETSQYDVLMVSDDADLADDLCRMSAKWIDETFADAEDHSIPVAVLSCRTAETGVIQADELIKIEEFSQKAKFTQEIECEDENMDTGLAAVENFFPANPDTQVFLTAHSGLGLGVNNYFTALSSPVTDYSNMGVFAINGDATMADLIKSSADGASPMRGMVLTGSVDDTANELKQMCEGIMDGSVEEGHVQKAGTMFVNADTVDEYLETGTVTSVTAEDFK